MSSKWEYIFFNFEKIEFCNSPMNLHNYSIVAQEEKKDFKGSNGQ